MPDQSNTSQDPAIVVTGTFTIDEHGKAEWVIAEGDDVIVANSENTYRVALCLEMMQHADTLWYRWSRRARLGGAK
jgi:hypothetical protein